MHLDCAVPELPTLGCVVPTASPTPTPAPSPTATASPTPSPAPSVVTTLPVPQLTQQPVAVFVPAPAPVLAPGPVALPAAVLPAVQAPVVATTTTAAAAPAASGVPLSSVVPSSYAIVVFGLIGVALLVSFLSGLRPASSALVNTGGTMRTQRTRLWAGLGTIALAAVVGGLGWYRISGEPLLNRQIPFLASAGIAVVVLAVLGGALVVAEQLRADQNRIGELENAVRALTDALTPMVEKPARRSKA